MRTRTKKIPNEKTTEAIEKTEAGIGIVECKDMDDLFDRLNVNDIKIKVRKHFTKKLRTHTK